MASECARSFAEWFFRGKIRIGQFGQFRMEDRDLTYVFVVFGEVGVTAHFWKPSLCSIKNSNTINSIKFYISLRSQSPLKGGKNEYEEFSRLISLGWNDRHELGRDGPCKLRIK